MIEHKVEQTNLYVPEDYNDYWQAGPTFPYVLIADVDNDGANEVIAAGCDTLLHCICKMKLL